MKIEKKVLIKWLIVFSILALWTFLIIKSLTINLTARTIYPLEDNLTDMPVYLELGNITLKMSLIEIGRTIITSDFTLRHELVPEEKFIFSNIRKRQKIRTPAEIKNLISDNPVLIELLNNIKKPLTESFWRIMPGPMDLVS